jgi:alpha-methylacyl-CoA racemase
VDAARAGHDINYIASSGLLNAIGRRGQPPTIPLNFLPTTEAAGCWGRWGLSAPYSNVRNRDWDRCLTLAMTDGIALLGIAVYGAAQAGDWCAGRGTNLLDGGAPWYDVYETADARFIAVGALEENFYRAFVGALDLDGRAADRDHKARWNALRECLPAASSRARLPTGAASSPTSTLV